MRKIILLLLCFSLLLSFFGCSEKEPEPQTGFKFYYPRVTATFGTSDSVITHEFRNAGFSQDDYMTQLTLYLMGPQSEDLRNCFPSGVSVVSIDIYQNTAFLVLSDLFAALSGLELTTACACLTLTLSGLTGVKAVQIQAQTQQLDGKDFITMTLSDLLLLDQSYEDPQS